LASALSDKTAHGAGEKLLPKKVRKKRQKRQKPPPGPWHSPALRAGDALMDAVSGEDTVIDAVVAGKMSKFLVHGGIILRQPSS
jgi:hypothetical protein